MDLEGIPLPSPAPGEFKLVIYTVTDNIDLGPPVTRIIHWVPPPGKINWIHACNICNSYSLCRPRDANNNNNCYLCL